MKAFVLYLAGLIYFKISRLLFGIKNQVFGVDLKVKFHTINKVELGKNVRFGKNVKLLIDKKASNNSFVMGDDSWLRDNVEINIAQNSRIVINKGATIQDGCKLLGDVSIGAGTLLAPNVFISSGKHHAFEMPALPIRVQDQLYTKKGINSLPVVIEEDCWIGYNVFVDRGAELGRGCIVGANSIVRGVIPPYSLVVGNSIVKKKRLDFDPPLVLKAVQEQIPYFYRGFDLSKNEIDKGVFWCDGNALMVLGVNSKSTELLIEGLIGNNKKNTLSIFINGYFYNEILLENKIEITLDLNSLKKDLFNKEYIPDALLDYLVIGFKCLNSDKLKIGVNSIKYI